MPRSSRSSRSSCRSRRCTSRTTWRRSGALERSPELPQVACFDTAMHRSNPPVAQMFALPAGAHRGGRAPLRFPRPLLRVHRLGPAAVRREGARGRTVVLHLGNGASMCALHAGRSVASTMGFTAVDGLPMGTRCGAIDPGVLLYLMDERGMDARALEKLIYQQSGLLGVSGVSSDMRVLLESAEPRAKLAVDLFVLPHRARARLARRGARRPRRDRLHRRHRRARRRNPRARVPPGRLARRRARRAGERSARPAHLHAARAASRPG